LRLHVRHRRRRRLDHAGRLRPRRLRFRRLVLRPGEAGRRDGPVRRGEGAARPAEELTTDTRTNQCRRRRAGGGTSTRTTLTTNATGDRTVIENLKAAESNLIGTLNAATNELNAIGTADLASALAGLERAADEAKKRLEAVAEKARGVLRSLSDAFASVAST